MLLVIHNLPMHSKYADIKVLIQSKCGVTDVILDNLVNEGSTKKVTVGLADDGDGAMLVRKINGLFVGGQQLYVEDVRQKKESEQPYRSSKSLLADPVSYSNTNYNASSQSDYPTNPVSQNQGFPQPGNTMAYQNQDPMMMMNMAAIGGMYYLPNMTTAQAQTSYMGYGGQMQTAPLMPQAAEVQAPVDRPFGFGDRAEENTHRDRQRQPYGDRRAPSPPFGGRDRDRQSSDWEGQSDARHDRRRSRSPRRGQWESRDRSHNQDQYDTYQEDPMTRDRNVLPDFNRPQQEMYPNDYNSNYGVANIHETPNAFGNHGMQSSGSGWQQPMYDRNQYDQPNSNQRGRNDYQNPQNARNPSFRDSRPYDHNSRGGPGQSRQSDNTRDESRLPSKRGINKWDNNEPQAKRFAQSKDTPRGQSNAPRRPAPNDGPRGAPNRPLNPNSGPRGPANVPNRPANPNFGTRGPSNAPNRPVRPNAGPKGAGPKGAGSKGATPNPKDKLLQGFSKTQKDAEPLEKLLNRDETWRGQAAAALAKEMLIDLKVKLNNGDKILTHLKQSIRARINVMLGDQISNRNDAIVAMYHQKFPSSGDQEFFSTVVNDLKAKEAEEAKNPKPPGERPEGSGGSGAVKPKPAAPGAAKPAPGSAAKKPVTSTGKPNVAAKKPADKPKTTQPTGSKGLLPKFPDGDKQSQKRIKLEEKKAWWSDTFTLPEDQAKALDEELDVLSDIFMSEVMHPEKDEDKPVCEQIADVVSDEFRKVIRIQVTKRVLKDTKALICRVFCPSRAPQRMAIEQFLAEHGCIALHKSDKHGKMYMAHFDSYDNYDEIVALGTTQIDGISVSFKAFQVCGPPPSAATVRQQHLERKKKFIQSQIDKSKVNLLDPGYVYDPSEARKAAEEKKSNTSPAETEQNNKTDQNEEGNEIVDSTADDITADVKGDGDNGGGDTCAETINIDDVEDATENVDEDDLEDW